MKALKHLLMLKDPKLSTSNKGGGENLAVLWLFFCLCFCGKQDDDDDDDE